MTMRYSEGNVLSFTPDSGWQIKFLGDNDSEWTATVVGWAVVAKYTKLDTILETEVQAVVVGNLGRVVTVADYIAADEEVTVVAAVVQRLAVSNG